jgi:hypothetical protein
VRSRAAALSLLILTSACTPDADTPTSVSPTDPPERPDRVLFDITPGGSAYVLDSSYTVSFHATTGSDSVTQTEESAVEDAFDSLDDLFDNSNEGLPEFDVIYTGTGDIQVEFDGDDPDDYYCGGATGGVISLTRFPSSATDCGSSGGQLTSELTGLILHEFGEELGAVPLANVDLEPLDLTYEKCVWPHYSYDKDSGYPSQLCRWDKQWVYALYEVRPVLPDDFYENPLIVDVALSAAMSTVFRQDTVRFTASLTQWDGDSISSADSAMKTWTKDGGSYVTPYDSTVMSVVLQAGATDDTLALTVVVDDTMKAILPWPEATATVAVLDSTPTAVSLPDSLVLTDDSASTLYQDLTAVTTPADPEEKYDYDWTISNTNIAHIVGGGRTVTIEGYSDGTALVIVEVEDLRTDTTIVVVECGTKRNPACIQYAPSPM